MDEDVLANAVNEATSGAYDYSGTGASNDFWGTLNRGLDVAGKVAAIAGQNRSILSRSSAPQTTSAPSGRPAWSVFNPFPGNFSQYPQADGKAAVSGPANAAAFMPWIIIGVVIFVFLAVFKR